MSSISKEENFLITGVSSGLGKYLHEHLGGSFFKRDFTNSKETEIIIHCAFNPAREINSENLYQYLFDSVFLAKKLTEIPHKKFIYISSVDVYPKNNKKHSEDEVIDIKDVSGIYAITKLMSESLVKNLCPNFLILRCSAFLGKDSRENSLIKIVKEKNPALTLSADSTFNYILHKDVYDFIKIALDKDLKGIYNLVSSENIRLSEVVDLLGKQASFGSYKYNVGNINNDKASVLLPVFKKASKEIISEFTSSIL